MNYELRKIIREAICENLYYNPASLCFPGKKLAAKEHSAASRNRIQTCPQNTRINAEAEKNSLSASICVICGHRPFLSFFAFCRENPRAYA
jgi:hypothetical protein